MLKRKTFLTNKKRRKHQLFYCFTFLFWLVTVILALELFALVLQLRMEKHNPLINAFINEQVLPVENCTTAIQEKANTSCLSPFENWSIENAPFNMNASMRQVLDWGPRDISMPESVHQERRNKFSTLAPMAREAYAQLNGELIFEIDERYRIRNVYGIHKEMFTKLKRVVGRFLLKRTSRLSEIRKVIDHTINDSQPRSLEITGPDEQPLHLVCIPDEEKNDNVKRVYIFADIHPDVYRDDTQTISDDSRWAIPSYRFKANFHSLSDPSFHTNRLGFRDDEIVIPKPDTMFRIVCVGGSTTEEGADNDHTYPNLLENYLQEAFPGYRIDVINAGIPGSFLHIHLLRLNDYFALEPDMLLLHAGVNDVMRQYMQPSVNVLPRFSYFIKTFMPSLCAPTLDEFIHQHYDYMGFSLELFTKLAQQHDIEVIYASIASPDPANISVNAHQYYVYQANSTWHLDAFSLPVYYTFINASNHLLQQVGKVHGVPCIAVDQYMTGSTDIFRDFCHLTPTGTEQKARVIFNALVPVLQKKLKSDTHGQVR